MSDPCQFQDNIMKHGEDIAKQGQSIEIMTNTLKSIAEDVSQISAKLNGMRGFVAGAAAAGGHLGGITGEALFDADVDGTGQGHGGLGEHGAGGGQGGQGDQGLFH